ncbi:MAG TPA: hypothetical protein V6D11_23055 [Waterburya sp.]
MRNFGLYIRFQQSLKLWKTRYLPAFEQNVGFGQSFSLFGSISSSWRKYSEADTSRKVGIEMLVG